MSDGLLKRSHLESELISKCFAHLLAQEVTDLELVAVLLDDAVDGEMGVDGTHLVLEAL